MRRVAAVLACVLSCMIAGSALTLLAQEGHPLTGTWHGDYGTSPTQRTQIVFLMHWDSKNVEGKVNPGANSVPLKVATLDASKWMVHFEADVKDKAGKPSPWSSTGNWITSVPTTAPSPALGPQALKRAISSLPAISALAMDQNVGKKHSTVGRDAAVAEQRYSPPTLRFPKAPARKLSNRPAPPATLWIS